MEAVVLVAPVAPTARERYAALLLFDYALALPAHWRVGEAQPGEIAAKTLPLEAVFAIATRTDALTGDRDRHDRPVYHFPNDRHRRPAIHDMALEIARQYGLVSRRGPAQADYLLTWDLDHPYRFAYKPAWVQLGSALKSLAKGDFSTLKDQLLVLLGQKQDPFDTYDRIQALSPANKTRIFLQLGRKSAHDTRHIWPNKGQKKIIQRFLAAGYTLGLHPSYQSSRNAAILAQELSLAPQIGLSEPFRHSRQHFLRYRDPETFRQLRAAGVQFEYSLAMSQDTGFVSGMAVPYPWYNLEKEEITDLMLVPGMIMDRTLLSYLALSPAEALAHAQATIAACRAVGGLCVLILHNDNLSEYGEWRGWSRVVEALIAAAKGES